ncbi:hypothetical protein BN2364_0958 [Alloalcanivorax xenomutans]|nr:hypothetical protein BN2364_0958 [Alloalcanivorax xenomutans]
MLNHHHHFLLMALVHLWGADVEFVNEVPFVLHHEPHRFPGAYGD